MQHLEVLEHRVGYGRDNDDVMMATSHADRRRFWVVGFAQLQPLYLLKYIQNVEKIYKGDPLLQEIPH